GVDAPPLEPGAVRSRSPELHHGHSTRAAHQAQAMDRLLRCRTTPCAGDQEARWPSAPQVRMTRATNALATLGIPLALSPMEALLVPDLPKDAEGWQFEPKWNGFRCLAFRAGREVEIKAKSGKSLSRFFPEVLANLAALPHATFVLDGELVIPIDGELSFDALQMRLHPAQSRINRLAGETPATLMLFDCLLTKPR